MKKVLSIFAAATALFCLSSCGGGGSDSAGRDVMTIQDLNACSKKFCMGYQVYMEIIPYDSTNAQRTGNSIQGVRARAVTGGSTVEMYLSYDMTSDTEAQMKFSVSRVDYLQDQEFLAGLGFAVDQESSSGTSVYLPNTLTSISGLNTTLYFDFAAQRVQTISTYSGYEAFESSDSSSSSSSSTTTEYVAATGEIDNGTTWFQVRPR